MAEYQQPVLMQVEWALRMFKESKMPQAVDVPLLLERVRQRLVELEDVRAAPDLHAALAAPDLLAALKAIVEHDEIVDGLGIRYTFDWQSPLGKQARAAIAKAEGVPSHGSNRRTVERLVDPDA